MKGLNGIDDILALTPLQQGMLFHTLYAPESSVYNLQIEFALEGDLDEGALEQAWRTVVERHTVLRTSFVWERVEKPYQVVHHHAHLKIARHDWRALSAAEQDERRRSCLEENRTSLFDLTKPPLMRLALIVLSEHKFRLVWTFHHIILEGWSAAIILSEVWKCYGDLRAHRFPDLPAVRPYAEFIRWLQQKDQSIAEAYWRERLKGFGAPTRLAIDRSIGSAPAEVKRVDSCSFTLSKNFVDALKGLARTHRVTLNTVVQGAWSILLSRYSGEEDVVFGAVLSGRPPDLPGVEAIVGLFVNTLPARVNVNGDVTLIPWLQALQLDQATMRQYEYSSLMQVQAWSDVPGGQPLFHTALGFQNWLGNFPSGQVIADLQVTELESHEVSDQPLTLFVQMGDTLTLTLVYDVERFERTAVQRMLTHCRILLEGMAAHPQARLKDLPLLTDPERHQLLVEWNDTNAEFPVEALLHELFEAQVQRTPERTALRVGATVLSYAKLDTCATRMAQALRSRGVSRGQRVGLCVERGADMLAAVLGILKAGAAYVPLDPSFPEERLSFMADDAQLALLVSTTALAGFSGLSRERQLLLDADANAIASAPDTRLPVDACTARPEDPAYVIYTSGSTGKPKGVVVPHRGVINFLTSMAREPGLTADDVLVAVTTLSFDIAVLELQLPLTLGATVVIATRDEAIDGGALSSLLERCRATVMQATPITWRLLLEAGWTSRTPFKALVGGEAMPKELADQLIARGVELWNMYGPTETTVWSTCARITDTSNGITIGKPIANTIVRILDAQKNLCPIGVVGELCIGGGGVTLGYWNRPELTTERFIPDPFSTTPRAMLYRTGDRARWRNNGTLEHLGRLDFQIKLRGFRIELGEIESTLDRHPAVRQSVVIVREEGPDGKKLVAYVIPESGAIPQIRELRQHVQERLPNFMVPSAVVLLDAFPLTPNGKIDRKALPASSYENLQAAHDFVRPHTETEQALAAIWTEVLKVEHIGLDDNFFDLGGHSLLAIKTVSRIRDVFEVDLPTRTLFEKPTLADWAKVLTGGKGSGGNVQRIEPRTQSGPCALSFAQERFWLLHQLAPASPVYNIVDVIRFEGTYEAEAMRRALKELVRRHEILRTAFVATHRQPMQIVLPTIDLMLSELDLSALPEQERERECIRVEREEGRKPFDLSQAPLLRGALVHLTSRDHRLLLTLHHIIADEWSMEVLHQEITQLYGAFSQGQPSPLPELPIQYADFACWQRDWLQGDVRQRQITYWKDTLAGAPSMLELPTDKPRPAVQSLRGATETFALPKDLVERLKSLGREHQATLFMTLEASFAALLHRYTGKEDILVGTPMSGRPHSETERLIGCFINTVVLRAQFTDDLTFRSLLHQVRERALGAYAHPDLPFEQLVAELAPERDPSRTPLIQVMFVLYNTGGVSQASKVSGIPELETGTSKFDLTLFISETEDGLEGIVEYSTDLFEAQTIRRLCGHYGALLQAIVRDPDRSISMLPLLTDVERHQLLIEWNRTESPYPKDKCIHQLFEAQVERTPDAVAVVFEDQRLTYMELNQRANQLAHHLQKLGVGPEVLVGICVERSLEMMIGLLGIWKAGGAYVPLDPTYPKDRLALIMEDSQVSVLLTQRPLADRHPGHITQVLCLDQDVGQFVQESASNPVSKVTVQNLAYIIYTSGTTGNPKGVMIEHNSLVNYLCWFDESPLAKKLESLPLITQLTFDASLKQLFAPLLRSRQVWILSDDVINESADLLRTLSTRVRVGLNCVPTLWSTLLDAIESKRAIISPQFLSSLFLGGEQLNKSLIDRTFDALPHVEIWNLYGPTEATANAIVGKISRGRPISLGHPIANTKIYILDSHLQPVPIGIPGELYIGGAGLARGYLNCPELTNEKFIPSPFSSRPDERIFKTGDLARYLPNGNIEFLGRIDNQVKIRGFRIEPGEIEAVLNQHPGLRETLVTAREEVPGDKRLVAYIVPNREPAPTIRELRGFLKQKLPNYMVPSAYVLLDSLPVTLNGKVDRHALPDPGRTEQREHNEYVAPRDETETVLCKLWGEILKVDRVGIDDDFFAIGGHSLLAAKLFSRLDEHFGRSLPLGVLFSAPTVRALAEYYRTSAGLKKDSVVVALRTGGTLRPLFAVPGVFGNVVGFADLARELGSEQPFYGLQSVGLDGAAAPLDSIEAMAKLYVNEIRSVQACGPYAIIGACFGATVAYEMARQLLEGGEEVAFLGLLSPTDREGNGDHENYLSIPRAYKRTIALSNFLSERSRLYLKEMESLNARDRIKYIKSKVASMGALVAGRKKFNGVQRELNQIEVYRANLCALDSYQRRPLKGRLKTFDIFEPAHHGASRQEPLGWNVFWSGLTKVHHVRGKDSGDMVSGENVRFIAVLLAARLRSAFDQELGSLRQKSTKDTGIGAS